MLLSHLFGSKRKPIRRPQECSTFRPRLESLENRMLLAVTPWSSSLELVTDASTNFRPGGGSFGASQFATTNPLAGTATDSEQRPFINGFLISTVGDSGAASWSDPASGSLNFTEDASLTFHRISTVSASFHDHFHYSFIPATDSLFVFTYDYSAGLSTTVPEHAQQRLRTEMTSTVSLDGFFRTIDSRQGYVSQVSASDSFTIPLSRGSLYTLNINQSFQLGSFNDANLTNIPDFMDASGVVNGTYTWEIIGNDPDIAMQSAQLQSANTAQFTYATTGNPGPFEVGVYPSADGITYTAANQIGSTLVTPNTSGGQATGTITITGLFAPDPAKPFLVVVADPPSAGKPKGEIIELNDTDPTTNCNGNNAASIQLPNLEPTFDNPDPAAPDLLHKLLYRGQTLSVPLFVKNIAGNAIGDITIEYYLSTNSYPDLNGLNNLLIPIISRTISSPAGSVAPLTESVYVPSDLAKGNYWLKAKLIPTNAAQDNNLDNNIAVSDPLTVCSETNSMTGGRATAFDSAVTAAKLNPMSPTWVISESELDARAEQVIKAAEGLRYDPYMDQLGVPTIGYGMALMDRATDGTLSYSDKARSRIEAANLVYSEVDRTFQNLQIGNVHIGTVKIRDGDVLSYKQVLALATLGKNSGPNRIGVEITDQAQADAWFDDDYKWVKKTAEKLVSNFQQLTAEARIALISLTYQLGPGKIKQFKGMLAAIEQGDMACAGFELMDSLYADQDPGRARSTFLLLVAGYEDQL